MDKFLDSKWKYFIVVISIALVAGLGSLFVNLGMDWFNTLTKPSQFVPAFVFGIVWSVIYIAFAVVICLWIRKEKLPKSTFVLLIVNGVLNALWCLLFFTLHNTILGLVAIIFNLIVAIILWINMYRLKPIYAYITSIYPIWISLATCLNLALWILN